MMIEIYTDGSCKKNGNGGWAFTIDFPDGDTWVEWGTVFDTTNNRMEMTAVIKALQRLEEDDIIIYTDSRYVIGGASLGWKQKKNLDLWPELITEVIRLQPEFKWVKGHNGNPRNEEVDKLAQEASGVR